LLEEAETGKIEIVTSTFTLVEVIKLDRERKLKKADEDKIVAFFEKPYIHLVAADRTICESARHLIWQFSTLQPKDSVHLASALAYAEKRRLDALFAWDADFTKLDGKVTTKFPIRHPFEETPSLLAWADSKADKAIEANPPAPETGISSE
jgi:predicted nucleic acid-binding protein